MSCIQNIKINIDKIFADDNPNGIKRGSLDDIMLTILSYVGYFCIVIVLYFCSVGLGLFGTYVAMSHNYNMTTGCKYNDFVCGPDSYYNYDSGKCTTNKDYCDRYHSRFDSNIKEPMFCSLINRNAILGECFLVGMPVSIVIVIVTLIIKSIVVFFVAYYYVVQKTHTNIIPNLDDSKDYDVVNLEETL